MLPRHSGSLIAGGAVLGIHKKGAELRGETDKAALNLLPVNFCRKGGHGFRQCLRRIEAVDGHRLQAGRLVAPSYDGMPIGGGNTNNSKQI